jgi:5-methylcytosine-specific restriction endonuclease McrA
MLVFVLNRNNEPLMPCSSSKARKLLKDGLARVKRKFPFTIKLIYGSSGYKQNLMAGMDTGSKNIGTAVSDSKGNILYRSNSLLRGEEIKRKMETRAMYRRSRRGRKTRYRKPRWRNRSSSRRLDRLAPSVKHKVDAHLNERKFVESILPISSWRLELANFDIHAISNPNVSKNAWWTYQKGEMYGYQNLKQYILDRDNYSCQCCKKDSKKNIELHIHHILFRSNGGADTKNNLITLCKPCHDKLHKKKDAQKESLKLTKRVPKNTKHATEVNIVASQLRKKFGKFQETFGFITKVDRQNLKLEKDHYIDASVIASKGNPIFPNNIVLVRRYVSKGDYQQTKGARSERKIPTGKLFGLRKFDLIKTSKGVGFVKGKRSSGSFAISDIFGNQISGGVNVKKNCKRISARKTVIMQEKD